MIEVVVLIAVGFWIGWRLHEYLHIGVLMSILKELGIRDQDLRRLAAKHGITLDQPQDTAAEHRLTKIAITVERSGQQLFAYRHDNSEFIAQGHTPAALIARIAERYTDVKMTVVEGAEHMKEPQ